MKWWTQNTTTDEVEKQAIEVAATVRDESETLRRKAEELRLAAEALIDHNSDHVRGAT